MVKVDFEKANIAIIGSTKLTKKLVDYLESINRPKIIFGLWCDSLLPSKHGIYSNVLGICSECLRHYARSVFRVCI